MKAFITIIAISFLLVALQACQTAKQPVEVTTVEQPVSDCIKVTNRNIAKAEINLQRIERQSLVDSTRVTAKKEAIRFNTMLDGLDASIVSCKSNKPEFDFEEIDRKVKAIRTKYENILDVVNKE